MRVRAAQTRIALALVLAFLLASLLGVGVAAASASGPDPSFGTDGRVDLTVLPFFDSYYKNGALAMAADRDSIYLTTFRGSISRLNSDGVPDTSYGRGSYQSAAPYVPEIRGNIYAPALAIQDDGKVLVAGSYGWRSFLSRLTPRGFLDPSFADGGAVLDRRWSGADKGWLTDVEIDARGRILVTGGLPRRLKSKLLNWAFVKRYLPNGRIDRSFACKGRALFKGPRSSGVDFNALELTKGGRIIVLRSSSKGASAFALTPRGKVDRRFAKRRRALKLPGAFMLDSARSGRITAFGITSDSSSSEEGIGCVGLYAFNWAGVRSKGFSGNGIRFLCPSRFERMFPPLSLKPKGIYMSGFALQGNGKPVVSLGLLGQPIDGAGYTLRLKADGALDRSFAELGLFRTALPSGVNSVQGLSDGVLIGAGNDHLASLPSSFVYRFRK